MKAEIEKTAFNPREIEMRVKSVDAELRQATFICSTERIDRHSESVKQDWILDEYLANPVFLKNHRPDNPIGKCVSIEVKENRLVGTFEFMSSDLSEDAEKCWRMVKAGFLKTVSVGFRPGKYNWVELDSEEYLELSQNTLYEVSLVTIPANIDAELLEAKSFIEREKQGKKQGKMTKEEFEELLKDPEFAAIAAKSLKADAPTDAPPEPSTDSEDKPEPTLKEVYQMCMDLTARVDTLEKAMEGKSLQQSIIDKALSEGKETPGRLTDNAYKTMLLKKSPKELEAFYGASNSVIRKQETPKISTKNNTEHPVVAFGKDL